MRGKLIDGFGVQDGLAHGAFLVARAAFLAGGGLVGDPIRGCMRLLGDLLAFSRNFGITNRAIHHRVVRADLRTGRSHLILTDGGLWRVRGKLVDRFGIQDDLTHGAFLVARAAFLAGGGLIGDPIRGGVPKRGDRIGFSSAASAYTDRNTGFCAGCVLFGEPRTERVCVLGGINLLCFQCFAANGAFLVARAGFRIGRFLIGDPIRGCMRLLGDLLTLSRKLGMADRAIDHRVIRADLRTGRIRLVLTDGGRGRVRGKLIDGFGVQDGLTRGAFLVARAAFLAGGGLIGDPIRGSMRLLGDLLTLSRKLGMADRAIDHRVIRAGPCTGRIHLILTDGGGRRVRGKLIDGLDLQHDLALGAFLVAQSVLLAGGGLIGNPIRGGMRLFGDLLALS